jgi:hypothetical protein
MPDHKLMATRCDVRNLYRHRSDTLGSQPQTVLNSALTGPGSAVSERDVRFATGAMYR